MRHYFTHNARTLAEFPCSPQPQPSALERDHQAPDLAATTRLFIREEQRHLAVLGRFLDQEQIPGRRQ